MFHTFFESRNNKPFNQFRGNSRSYPEQFLISYLANTSKTLDLLRLGDIRVNLRSVLDENKPEKSVTNRRCTLPEITR